MSLFDVVNRLFLPKIWSNEFPENYRHDYNTVKAFNQGLFVDRLARQYIKPRLAELSIANSRLGLNYAFKSPREKWTDLPLCGKRFFFSLSTAMHVPIGRIVSKARFHWIVLQTVFRTAYSDDKGNSYLQGEPLQIVFIKLVPDGL